MIFPNFFVILPQSALVDFCNGRNFYNGRKLCNDYVTAVTSKHVIGVVFHQESRGDLGFCSRRQH